MSRTVLTALVAASTLAACDTQSQVFTHTTNSVTAPITAVIVELDSGSIQVTGADVDQVKSAAVAEWYGERPDVQFVEEGTTLRIIALCGHADCGVDLAFEMPAGAELQIDGGAAEITVNGVRGVTSIDNESGDLTLKKVGGSLEMRTGEGKILGEGLIATRTVAETNKGAIELEFTAPFSSVAADTVNGDITMTVPRMAYFVDAKSGDGAVEVDVETADISDRTIHAVATESGNISILPGVTPPGAAGPAGASATPSVDVR